MLRRTFFKWLGAVALPFALPRWMRAQASPFTGERPATLRAIADAVLPASLGPRRIESATSEFTRWVSDYKAGAEMSAGYGFTRIQVLPPSPSAGYGAHLDQLEGAARERGASFSALDIASRRALVQAALDAAKVEDIPRRPNGKHVAADLMGHFFFISSAGHDFLYNAAIKRDGCRGLGSSGDQPKPVR